MNYQRIHDEIINRALSREAPQCYCERHHIVPKSMGGTDQKSNLVLLTSREHYLIHWMLFKIHRNRSMAFAWYRMTSTKQSTGRYTSHTFSYAKAAKSQAVSALFLGRKLSPEHKEKLSDAKRGRTYVEMGRDPSSLAGRKISEAHKEKVRQKQIGRKRSDLARKTLSERVTGSGNHRFGKVVSAETRAKLSESAKKFHAKRLNELEGPHEPRRDTVDSLKAIKTHYTTLTKQLREIAA